MFWYLRWFFVLGGFPPPKLSGVCFYGIDYLVRLARGGLTKHAISKLYYSKFSLRASPLGLKLHN